MESFLNTYKSKDIIYPNQIAKQLNISVKETYNLCENNVGKELKKVYLVRCPVCGNMLESYRYYAMGDIRRNIIYRCKNCGTEFKILLEDITTCYEKL